METEIFRKLPVAESRLTLAHLGTAWQATRLGRHEAAFAGSRRRSFRWSPALRFCLLA